MIPMVGFSGSSTWEMARVMSYSRSFSRFGARNGIATRWSARLTRQAEIKIVAGGKLLRFQSVEPRGVFRVGVRLRIIFLDDQIFAGNLLVFVQQVFDLPRVIFQDKRFPAWPSRFACSRNGFSPAYRASAKSPSCRRTACRPFPASGPCARGTAPVMTLTAIRMTSITTMPADGIENCFKRFLLHRGLRINSRGASAKSRSW